MGTLGSVVTLILLPSLAAFFLLVTTPVYRFHFKHQTAERALFWVLISALALNCISAAILEIGMQIATFVGCPVPESSGLRGFTLWGYELFQKAIQMALPGSKPDSVTYVSILIAFVIYLYFWLWEKFKPATFLIYQEARRRLAVQRVGEPDALETLLISSFEDFVPLMFNLKNGKVYIGWVTNNFPVFKADDRKSVSIFVIGSGYRKKDDHHFQFENDYAGIIADLLETSADGDTIAMGFELGHVMQTSEIVSVTPWLESVYEKVQDNHAKKKTWFGKSDN